MEYKYIRKYLGEEWLDQQKKFIANEKRVKIELKDKISDELEVYILNK